jgi:hypothetical protein
MAFETKLEIGADSFAALTRLFISLKRAGRVIDVVWFQESPEYARAVLALADELDDHDVADAADRLRMLLQDWLMPRRNGSAKPHPPVAAAPVERRAPPEPAPAPKQPQPFEPRYKTTLR